MTVKLKLEPGATYDSIAVDSVLFLASPWGQDSTGTLVREVDSPNFLVPADGQWHDYLFDFGSKVGVPLWDGTLPPGDLSSIEAILFESVLWPSTYELTFSMDDFKLGDAAAPLTRNKEIPSLNGKFWTEVKITPSHSPMNAGVGLGKTEVGTWADMGPIVRFNTEGFIDVFNGTGYAADVEFPYAANTEYIVEFIGDVATKTYQVIVKAPEQEKVVIATDYIFRSDNTQDELNYLAIHTDDNVLWGGVKNSFLTASFMQDDYVLGWNTLSKTDLAMTDKFNVKFNLTPTANLINAGFAMSQADPALLGWGDLSTIIRFNGDGFIDARDGNTYNADAAIVYSAETIYSFNVDVDVVANTYSLSVTPQGGSEMVVGTDYGFRKEADTLNFMTKLQLNGGLWGGAEGDLLVSDIVVTPTSVNNIDLIRFNIYPNPVSHEVIIDSEENINKVVITDILGVKYLSLNTDNRGSIKLNITSLPVGSYIINVYTDKGMSAGVMIKK